MRRALPLLFCLAPLAGHARTLAVGPGQPFALPSAAAAAAADGDTIVIAAGTYTDCAVLRADGLTIAGAPGAMVVIAGRLCEGKAILVTQGDRIAVRNLTLSGAAAPEGNGAGLRDESRTLTVDRVRFVGDQDGILAGASANAALSVQDSVFLHNGACIHACAHAIYAGNIALLRVDRSVFRDTQAGHHIKSRAARTEIRDCTIVDGPTGTASYLIDIPDGGAVLIRGNTLEKGPRSQNHRAAIIIGEESAARLTPEITIQDNSFRNDGVATRFIDNRTATTPLLARNSIVGP